MKKVTTKSGSVYLIDSDGPLLKRVSDNPLRRDDEWITGYSQFEPQVGYPMFFIMENLSGEEGVTYRQTTEVVSVEEVHEW